MTHEDLLLLKTSVDQVVVLETAKETILAKVLFVFDGEDTPAVFYLEMKRGEDGRLTPLGKDGYSTLLAEIVAVRPLREP